MPAIWHNTTDINLSSMPENLKPWVLHQGSMTARLKKTCNHFNVQVLKHDWDQAEPQDINLLNLKNKKVIVRDVLLSCDNVPWIFARTIFPEALIKTMGDDFLHLGERPLGEILFSEKNTQRSEFELAELKKDDEYFKKAADAAKQSSSKMWARRSIFNMPEGSLLLTEVFLPAFLSGVKNND